MPIRVRTLAAVAAAATAAVTGGASAPAAPSGVPSWPDRVHLFDYAPAPLTITEAGVQHRLFADVHDITYAPQGCTPVAAYLVVPTQARPRYAAILFGHWLGPGSS